MKKKSTNNILAILTAVLFILLFIPSIDIYLKGVASILICVNFWIDVDINSITNVILPGRGGVAEKTTNKKIAVTFTVFTVILWVYIVMVE